MKFIDTVGKVDKVTDMGVRRIQPDSEPAALDGAREPAAVAWQGPLASVSALKVDERPASGERADADALVPPVRTIVVDREPVPVLPPPERESIRVAGAAGAERLRLENVSVHYGAKQAVKSVSLPIHQGEVLALIGPSGCGKTTLLRTLNRLTELTPSSARGGRVLLDGNDVDDLPDTALRARVAMVFQQPNPFPMSIFDNVAFALREQSRKRPRRRELEPLVVDALRRAALYDEVRDDFAAPHCGSPGASSSACASRGRSRSGRRCCCSTSPARRSTRSRRA